MATRNTVLRSIPARKSAAAILGRLRLYRLFDDPLFESVTARKIVSFRKIRSVAR
jgi:hypothetical protein